MDCVIINILNSIVYILVVGIQEFSGIDGQGYLKVHRKQLWLPLCASGWNDDASSVACHQLGYTTFIHISTSITATPNLGNSYWFGRIACTGSEESLTDCRSWGWTKTSFCTSLDLVQVKCIAPRRKYYNLYIDFQYISILMTRSILCSKIFAREQ